MSVSCEKMVKFVVPWIRRELALEMVREHGLPQVRVAKALEVTESAVSQYLSRKRGIDVEISDEVVIQELKRAAAFLSTNCNGNASKEICNLCKLIRKRHAIPDIIRKKANIDEFDNCICGNDN